MKNLSNNTQNFLEEVKHELDNANWDYEGCNPRASYADCEKAINYLTTQTFSITKIKETLEECWEDYRCNVRSLDTITTHEDCVELAAGMIASSLAFCRISRYQATGWDLRTDSKKWYIDETVTFIIK